MVAGIYFLRLKYCITRFNRGRNYRFSNHGTKKRGDTKKNPCVSASLRYLQNISLQWQQFRRR
jgi:hypothetical protein